jgi:hypothetical protein
VPAKLIKGATNQGLGAPSLGGRLAAQGAIDVPTQPVQEVVIGTLAAFLFVLPIVISASWTFSEVPSLKSVNVSPPGVSPLVAVAAELLDSQLF